MREVRQPVGGEDQGGRLEHQGIQRRPDLDGLVAVVEAANRTEAIVAGTQLGLKLRADLLPPPADIPHVIVGRIVPAAFAQPGIRLLQDGLGGDLVHPVHRCPPSCVPAPIHHAAPHGLTHRAGIFTTSRGGDQETAGVEIAFSICVKRVRLGASRGQVGASRGQVRLPV